MSLKNITSLIIFSLVIAGCETKTGSSVSDAVSNDDVSKVKMVPSPAPPGSGEPNMFTSENGEVFLSWVEQNEEYSRMMFSRFDGQEWGKPVLIAEGKNWFVNWADFPSLAVHRNGRMAAHYLAKNGEGTFAYGVNVVFSMDKGQTWSEPVIPHETETETEHGFVSLLPYEDGYFAAWLDGRNTGGGHGHSDIDSEQMGAMTIRVAFLDDEGNVLNEYLLDDKTCDCCQTSAVITENGPVVAYRDRSDEEIRDISIVRWTGSGWSDPVTVNQDNWLIPGCPVNGPVLAAHDDNVAVVWFTSPDQNSSVKLAFSNNNGKSFGDPIQIDLGHPIGRVDMEMLEDNSVFVTWMEAEGEMARIMVAHYSNSGDLMDQFVLDDNRSDRASGFPRMSLGDGKLFFAWRNIMKEPVIRTAIVSID